MAAMVELTPERARIFRITHVDNVPWILENGLHCGSSNAYDPRFVQIGNPDLITKRTGRSVPIPPGGTLHDYVPFYFTPFSPMLYNIKTGWNGITRRPMREIVILVSSLSALAAGGVSFVFTDRHAYLATAQFSSDLANLAARIDWQILQKRDFARDPDDPGKFERYQAEALAHGHVPLAALTGIVCYGPKEETYVANLVQNAEIPLSVASRPTWFF
jgi:ssDNA thymidine ADP-ribosyltransferase, DarT